MQKASLIVLLVLSFLSATIHRATLDGMVNYEMKSIVERTLEGIADADTVIFIMNTDGGRVDAAIDIADQIFAAPQWTIAFIEQRAISAGALISVSCNEIVMKRGSTMGDCAPIMVGSEGPKMLGEKFQSPLRAKFRVFSDGAGYPATLAEAMVSIDLEVYKITEGDSVRYIKGDTYAALDSVTKSSATLIVKKGELLTLSNQEAQETGFSKGSFESLEGFLTAKEMQVTGKDIKRDPLISFLLAIFPLLLVVGMAAVFIESKAPGIGVPGVVGVLCLAVAFASKFMVGLAGGAELMLLLMGFILLAAEVFVFPGFGVSGTAGIICIAIAGILAMQNFIIPSSERPWEGELFMSNLKVVGYSFVGAVALIVLFFMFVFPRLNSVLPGTFLEDDLKSKVDDKSQQRRAEKEALIGQSAEVVKELRPSGAIKIGGKMYDATAESFYITKGSRVTIVAVKGPYLIVEQEA